MLEVDVGSRELIRADLQFLAALVSNEPDQEVRAVNAIQYFVLASLVVFEAARYLKRFGYELDDVVKKQVEASRHSLKLFNNSERGLADQVQDFASVTSEQRSWFLTNNRIPGLLARFPKLGQWLVNDTTVHLVQDRIVATSQSIDFHMGVDLDRDPEHRFHESVRLGTAMAEIAELVGIEDLSATARVLGNVSPRGDAVAQKDARAESLYKHWFPNVDLGQAAALGELAVVASSFKRLLASPALTGNSLVARGSVIKFVYIMSYQLHATLRELLAAGLFELPVAFKDNLNNVLDSHSWLQDGKSKELRNDLVHYGLDPKKGIRVQLGAPLAGLCEHYFQFGAAELAFRSNQFLLAVEEALWSLAQDVGQPLNEPH